MAVDVAHLSHERSRDSTARLHGRDGPRRNLEYGEGRRAPAHETPVPRSDQESAVDEHVKGIRAIVEWKLPEALALPGVLPADEDARRALISATRG